jgi:mannitol/fructose-specific phosphotransferase system IIA component (Ntr-type)
MEILKKACKDESLILDLDASSLDEIFHAALELIVEQKHLAPEHRQRVEEALQERERQVSTAIGHAVAIPHAYLDCFEEQVVVFVRLASSVNLGAPDGIATRFVFILLGPKTAAAEHLDTLTTIARLMSDEVFRYDAVIAQNSQHLLTAMEQFHLRTLPGATLSEKKIDESLEYTGKLFGGVKGDIGRKLPIYRSDFKDGLHPKSLSSTLFLFFACLAPAVTFGGIMADYTGNNIGAVEMIMASAICGIIYALFSGQPMIILGGTGPLLIFTMILYNLCVSYQIEFLAAYAWVGLWSGLFLLILAATDASCLMKFFTRFTDEIFAALISIIFIYAALEKLFEGFDDMELAEHHATAVLTLLLALGTLYIANSLSRFRKSRYLSPWTREFLSDFGPTIALIAMTFAALWMHDVDLKQLPTPETVQPTRMVEAADGSMEPRSWLVSLTDVPGWVPFAAIVPALLVTVLVFVDQNITARLVNSPDHKLKKGGAYHFDVGLVGGLIAVTSMFGFPWLVAATVRSLNHVRSLATFEEVVVPGGGTRERIIHTRETRVTGLCIHLLVGLSLFLLPLMSNIPMAVLYGLFLFMGLVSMSGNQFFERLSLWAMESNLYPSTHYIRKVPNSIIHKFTFLQLGCLVVLMVVEVGPPMVAILFPLFLVLLVPVRLYAGRFFQEDHLAALDAEEEPEEEETDWSS